MKILVTILVIEHEQLNEENKQYSEEKFIRDQTELLVVMVKKWKEHWTGRTWKS